MSVFESVLYGIISGLAEFLPISSQAVQTLMLRIFGGSHKIPLLNLLIHVSVLLGMVLASRKYFVRLVRESQTAKSLARLRNKRYELRGVYEIRLVKTASIPMLLGLFITLLTFGERQNLLLVVIFSLLYSIVLFLPDRIPSGNKDARCMSAMDAILIGIGAAVTAIPGVSRVGMVMAIAAACGADKRHAFNWALLLSIPAVAVLSVFDVVGIIQLGFGVASASELLGYIVSAVCAFAGAYLSVMVARSWIQRSGFSGPAYCSLGIAIVLFILYLIV